MKLTTTTRLLCALSLFLTLPLMAEEDFSGVKGFKDACRAGALLDANHIPYTVVVFHSLSEQGAGCLYRLNGDEYLYSERGSAKVVPEAVARAPKEKVSRDQVLRVADGDRDIRNGCLVDATCAFHSYQHDPHIVWSGVIAAQVINANMLGETMSYRFTTLGHAITAYETDKREVYIQENGDEPRRVDWLTEKAQRGDRSWYDSSALIFADHHIQAVTTFKDQSGQPM
jgi:hypothetical protein